MNDRRLRVVWVCHFSDSKTRAHLSFKKYSLLGLFLKLLHRQYYLRDFAIWVSNAIKEFEKYEDIDLSVVFPHSGVKKRIQQFDINNIHYYCYKSEDDNLYSFIIQHVLKKVRTSYAENRIIIKNLISDIKPDVVHVIGAENPYYSIAALDVPDDIPSIVTLQTLMSDPDFLANYPISKASYEYRSGLEKQVIRKSRYIGSRVERFRSIVRSQIKKDAVFLNISLAVGVEIDEHPCEKEFDFVYFAANINKACDDAIEAFAIAQKKNSNLKLNVSGSYTPEYKSVIDKRVEELGLQQSVIFSGSKDTHEEVIAQIKKSKFALLPLKVDLISGTIREAMACGLPVVTTITPITPELNEDRECVLLSEKGDYQAMAENMIRLVEDESFASQIRDNAIKTVQERYSNETFMQNWRMAYHEIVEKTKNGTSFSEEIVSYDINICQHIKTII